MNRRVVRHRPVRPGALLGIAAPAGPVDPSELEAGVRRLQSLGFKIRIGKSVERRFRYLAGEDSERAADLISLFLDPEVAAVICARGGFGSSRLLSHLDARRLSRGAKPFVGSSDVTSLLLFFRQRLGWVVYHGPMVAPNFGRSPSPITDEWFVKALGGGPLHYRFDELRALSHGSARGRLTGGCLSLLCASLSTPEEIDTRGAILFVEDAGEPPYRIDRMLTQLIRAGKFAQVRGVIFGQMPGCHPPPVSGYTLQEILGERLAGFKIPILWGFPSGHGALNVTLPFGLPATIQTDPPALMI